MNLGFSRLDGRFIWVMTAVIVIISIVTLYAHTLVSRTATQAVSLIQNSSILADALSSFKTTTQLTEGSIYQYAIDPSAASKSEIHDKISLLKKQANILLQLEQSKTDKEITTNIDSLTLAVQRLDVASSDFLLAMSSVEKRYPGMPILLQLMEPTNRKFSEAVELALQEGALTDKPPHLLPKDQYQVLQHFHEARYAWSQMTSWLRVFVSNRMGAFGDPEISMRRNLINRQLFADKTNLLLASLKTYDDRGLLELQQTESLSQMQEAAQFYEDNIGKAVKLYLSPNWRTDLPILVNNIKPTFDDITALIAKTEYRIKAFSTSTLTETQNVAFLLSRFIWVFTGIVITLLGLAYIAFQKSIRMPILKVSRALKAEARGEANPIFQESKLTEINQLVSAFNGMQLQVHTRQQRLEAILTNAAEGIITIDEAGKIESCNKAAEILFGYNANELHGNNVSILVDSNTEDMHARLIAEYVETGRRNIIGQNREVKAKRKDGSVFHMSLKISELMLGDKRLFTAIVEDISERNAMMEHLRFLAEHDALTGLYNRQFFLEEMDRVIAGARRNKKYHIACVYIDLDNFKYVNDTHGHLAGDRLLQEVTAIFKQRTRRSDILCRLGGDEFALLFNDVEDWQAKQAAEQYREEIEQFNFNCGGKPIDIGCSIGVAFLTPEDDDKEALLARADIACHVAKNAGRNNVHVYKDTDRENFDNTYTDMGWSARIKDALEYDHFEIALQSIAHTSMLGTFAYEALIRMRDPQNNELIMPSGFLGAAERFGLMPQVDCWVIKNTLEIISRHLKEKPEQSISINLSAKSIGQDSVIDVIKESLLVNAVQPAQVIFEITEDVAISDMKKAVEFLSELRRFGCKTALDDFGVGYCSFSYLKDLPVDFVKIDGSFIRSITENDINHAVIKAINDICHTANIKTVAEFVETKDQYRLLKQIGVDYVQGYFIERPLLAHEILGENVISFPGRA